MACSTPFPFTFDIPGTSMPSASPESNEATKSTLLDRSKKLCKWIEDGECTIRWPSSPVEDLKLSDDAIGYLQRLISQTGPTSAISTTYELTHRSHMSAVMLYISKRMAEVNGIKTVAFFAKMSAQYKPRERTNSAVVGLLSFTYSAIWQMINHLEPGPCHNGNKILEDLDKLDGTFNTFGQGVDVISRIRPLLGNDMLIMVDKITFSIMGKLETSTYTQILRCLGAFETPNLSTRIWLNTNKMDNLFQRDWGKQTKQDRPDDSVEQADLVQVAPRLMKKFLNRSRPLHPVENTEYTEYNESGEVTYCKVEYNLLPDENQKRAKRVGDLEFGRGRPHGKQ